MANDSQGRRDTEQGDLFTHPNSSPEQDPEKARVIRQFQQREQPEIVDAEFDEPEADKPADGPVDAEEEFDDALDDDDDEDEIDDPSDSSDEQTPEQTEAERANAKRYAAIHRRLFLADILATIAALALFLFLGASANLRTFVEWRISANAFAVVACYGILATTIYTFIVLIPLHYIDYWYERRFGLSRQSFSAWLIDEFKSMGLNMLILVLFLEIVYGLLRATPTFWWVWAGAAWTLLIVVFAKLTPVILIPLFYKKEPLHDEELAERLRHLVERVRMNVVAVEKLGLGAKTVKANAMLAGLGNTKRVLLGDTLLEHFTPDEIETVLAHELGHHYFHHIWKHIAAGAVATFAGFFIASTVLRALVDAFMERAHLTGVADVAAFPILAFALFVMALIAMPLTNGFSRALERQADHFALRLTRKPEAFISAMKRLAHQNLADTEPSRLVETLLYSHPSIARRIAAAERFRDEEL